jgi:general secretion pathway protein J
MFTMKNKDKGFTLLEILIALFIFTIISMILVSSLRSVMDSVSLTENKADRLRKLQMALLVMSRDVEQAINRPVMNVNGKVEAAFVGSAHGFTFTHTGFANPTHTVARSTMQRTVYQWQDEAMSRITWDVLDQAPKSQSHERSILTGVTEGHFKYLDKNGRFYNEWPLNGQDSEPLPRAVRVYLTLANWGTLTQLYVIPVQIKKTVQAPQQPGSSPPTQDGEKHASSSKS